MAGVVRQDEQAGGDVNTFRPCNSSPPAPTNLDLKLFNLLGTFYLLGASGTLTPVVTGPQAIAQSLSLSGSSNQIVLNAGSFTTTISTNPNVGGPITLTLPAVSGAILATTPSGAISASAFNYTGPASVPNADLAQSTALIYATVQDLQRQVRLLLKAYVAMGMPAIAASPYLATQIPLAMATN